MKTKLMHMMADTVLLTCFFACLGTPTAFVDSSNEKVIEINSLCVGTSNSLIKYSNEYIDNVTTSDVKIETVQAAVTENNIDDLLDWETGYVTTNNVYAYEESNESSNKLKDFSLNDKIEYSIEAYGDEWATIKCGDSYGFINLNYISDSVIKKYPDENIEFFATMLYLEAGTQGRDCMMMVGNVILNRIESDFGKFSEQHTIRDVVSAKGQYPGTYKVAKKRYQYSETAYEVAEYLITYGSQDTKPLYQHFKRKVRGTKFYKQIGTEVFSY